MRALTLVSCLLAGYARFSYAQTVSTSVIPLPSPADPIAPPPLETDTQDPADSDLRPSNSTSRAFSAPNGTVSTVPSPEPTPPPPLCTKCLLQALDPTTIAYSGIDNIRNSTLITTAIITPWYFVYDDGFTFSTSFETKIVTLFVPTVVVNNQTNGTDVTVLADDVTWEYSGATLTYPTQYVVYSQFNVQPDCSATVTPLTITQTEITKVFFPVATGGAKIGTDVIGFLEDLPEFGSQFNGTDLDTCDQEIQGGQTELFPVPEDATTVIDGASVVPEATSSPAEAAAEPRIKPRLPIPVGPRTAALEFPGAGNYTTHGRQATGAGGTGVTPTGTSVGTDPRTTTTEPPLPPPLTTSEDPRTRTTVQSAIVTTIAGNSGARAGTRTTVAVLTEATAPASTSVFTRGVNAPPTITQMPQVVTPVVNPPSQPPNPSPNPPNPNPRPNNPNPASPPNNRPTNPGGIIGDLLNPSQNNGGNRPNPTPGGNPPNNNPSNNNPSNNPPSNNAPSNNNPSNNPSPNNPSTNNPGSNNPGSNNPQPGQSITIGNGPPVVITPAPSSQGGNRPGGIVLGPGSTLLPGQSTNVNGVPVVLGPSGSNLVIGGSSTVAVQPAAPNANPTPAQSVNIGAGAPIAITPAPSSNGAPGGVILGPGSTLLPGQSTNVNGVPVVLGPSGTNLIIGGTSTVPINPAGAPAATAPPVLSVGGAAITANPSGGFVIAPGTTLTPGGAVTVGGTTFSLPASSTGAPFVVVNGRTSTLGSAAAGPITAAPVLTIDGTTFAPSVSGGSTFYVIDGSTLRPGEAITVDGTRVSLGPDGTVLVIGSITSTARGPRNTAATTTVTDEVGDFVASGIGIQTADAAVLARRGTAEGVVEGVVMGVVGMVMWVL